MHLNQLLNLIKFTKKAHGYSTVTRARLTLNDFALD